MIQFRSEHKSLRVYFRYSIHVRHSAECHSVQSYVVDFIIISCFKNCLHYEAGAASVVFAVKMSFYSLLLLIGTFTFHFSSHCHHNFIVDI